MIGDHSFPPSPPNLLSPTSRFFKSWKPSFSFELFASQTSQRWQDAWGATRFETPLRPLHILALTAACSVTHLLPVNIKCWLLMYIIDFCCRVLSKAWSVKVSRGSVETSSFPICWFLVTLVDFWRGNCFCVCGDLGDRSNMFGYLFLVCGLKELDLIWLKLWICYYLFFIDSSWKPGIFWQFWTARNLIGIKRNKIMIKIAPHHHLTATFNSRDQKL